MSNFSYYPITGWATYPNFASFPSVAPDGYPAYALNTNVLYAYDAGTLSWVAVGGGGGTWGSITGTLSSQTDLITYLGNTYVPYTGATGNVNLGTFNLTLGDSFTFVDGSAIDTVSYGPDLAITSGVGNIIAAPDAGKYFKARDFNSGFLSTFSTAGITANRTHTLPNAAGVFAISANGNTANSAGNIILTQGSAGGATIVSPTTNSAFLYGVNNPSISGTGNVFYGVNGMTEVITGNDNVGMGNSVLDLVQAGNRNVAIGSTIMEFVDSADDNVAIGSNLLNAITDISNSGNIAIGNHIGENAISTSLCTMIGAYIGSKLATGNQSTLIGAGIFASPSSTTSNDIAIGVNLGSFVYEYAGSDNIIIGSGFAANSTAGTYAANTVSVGAYNLQSIINGVGNVAYGSYCLNNTTDGQNNLAIGSSPLFNNTLGGGNVAIGNAPLYNNTTGNGNIAIGDGALFNNTTATGNFAIGTEAAYSCAGGGSQGNMAIGTSALHENVSGEINLAIGYQALYFCSSSSSTGIGFNAGAFVIGGNNLFIGSSAGQGNPGTIASNTASDNTAVGTGALASIKGGSANVAIGTGLLASVTDGVGNVAVGGAAGGALTTGNFNTLFGLSAGLAMTTSASSNILIGYTSGANLTTGSNNIAIGVNQSLASATASNQLNIGNFIYGTGLSGTTTTISNALIGFGIKSPVARVHVTNETLGNEVFRLESIATNDDPAESVFQNRLTTTDGTQTTIHTFTVPASTTYTIEANVVARRTGGSAGTAEDGAYYQFTGTYKNVAGTATIIGAISATVTQESQAGFDATFTLAGATVLCKVTGATNNNIVWHMTARVWKVGT